MNSLILKLEDVKTVRPALQGVFTEMQTSFAEMAKLAPEGMRDQLLQLKAKTDQFLASLAGSPTEQVPAANEASWALRNLAMTCAALQETQGSVMAMLNEMGKRFTPLSNELQGLKEKQEKGELVPATQVTEAIENTRREERQRAERLQNRRTELQSLNLPVPADSVLDTEKEEAFGQIKSAAQERMTTITELGANKGLSASELCGLIYGAKDEFDRTIKVAKQLAASRSGGEGTNLEPLAGGSNGAAGTGENQNGGGEGSGARKKLRAF